MYNYNNDYTSMTITDEEAAAIDEEIAEETARRWEEFQDRLDWEDRWSVGKEW